MTKLNTFAASALLCLLAFTHLSSAAQTWRIAVISDMNQSEGSPEYTPALKKAIEHIRANNVAAVLSTGDMVAGQKTGLNYARLWNAFHDQVSRKLDASNIPFLPSPGNHDAAVGNKFKPERDQYQRTWNEFPVERFNAGRAANMQIHFLAGVEQNFPLNYAVTMGPALFIAMDATLPGGLINNQFAWLESVLQKSAPYTVKIVFGHFPLFPFTFQRAHEHLAQGTLGNGFYKRMEDLLEQHQVDLFLSGHHHAFFPGRRLGRVRYVSVPLLGTGSRYLLTADRSEKERAPHGFLYLDFDAAGNVALTALRSPSLQPITSESLPPAISVPRVDAGDCKGCRGFPDAFFIEPSRRILYHRF